MFGEAGEYVPESAGACRRQFPWSEATGGRALPGVGAQNCTEVLCQSYKCSQLLSPLSSPGSEFQ